MGLLDILTDPEERKTFKSWINDPEEMRLLRQRFLDSVNRGAVAGTVGGPVDVAAMGINALRSGYGYLGKKAGLLTEETAPKPIEKPVGGSEWFGDQMQRLGMVSNYRNPTAELYAAGILAPMSAAALQARAPQIAAAANQVIANAQAPRQMRNYTQRGAMVWHGSPHKFDKFDSSKIGTGEGAQAYGYGIYTAESEKVAQSYADFLGEVDTSALSTEARRAFEKSAREVLKATGNQKFATQKYTAAHAAQKAKSPAVADELWGFAESTPKYKGNLYKVDLPDEQIAKMLDWDKPLSQQPENVRSVFGSVDPNGRISTGLAYERWREKLGVDPVAASEKLKSLGIPGIRYLDGGSRGIGQGTSNFVIFPGNESFLKIIERNGQPIAQGLLE